MHPRTTLAAALCLLSLTACSTSPPPAGTVEHVVLMWLKQPGNEVTKARLVATANTFPGQIPGILSMSVGDALMSDREVVDDSFDLALVMRFRDAAALAAYEVHPIHTAAVRDVLTPNVARIVVYDTLVR